MKTLREFYFHICAFVITMALAFANSGCAKGAPGRDGHDTVSNVVGVITPCQDLAKTPQEVLLVLADGQVIGDIGKGNNRTMVSLTPGIYSTRAGCEYTLTLEMNVLW